ncbi:aldo/keto reductase [Sphingomonas bacterium]|uniref:aldo/keto reductase n=1 Tax=Sphingomonas bacterium TaxID=1895847 RepID=UPI001576DC78|nr:aldo/keto reductase [Sphingomonas bacterium]
MLYSKLGHTGLIVSRLSFGAMTFTIDRTTSVAKTDAAGADALMGRAIEAGINFFDTADVYSGGDSEIMLGKLLAGRRDEVVLATKAGWRAGEPLNRSGLSAQHLHWSIDQSLKRLGTDHVDVYIAHRDDANTPLEETLAALDAIVKAGKARYLGFSNWSAWKVAAAMELQRANGWAPFTHGQMSYSLLKRGIESEVAPMMRRYGLGLTAWSPLAAGFLSGKYSRDGLSDPTDRLSKRRLPFNEEWGFGILETVRGVAEAHGASLAQVAIAWLLVRDLVSSVLLGASKLAQLDDTLGALDLVLTAADITALDAATKPRPSYPGTIVNVADAEIAAALARRPVYAA